ncbi:MAG: 4-hydroxy-tetrahydrodipicolinate synthase [Lachnospiraceae bacterium]|nr:4-hydroxy-tetrahydrodipicolinate synthase [Lachnospiraceae bacterium]MBQ5430378.1 4-hydroxy-tetrahydrodipicolinate synthase [Lachnospiraceae bacterium]MBQ5484352.1 4-hydroxy-tetrahydrodipicolinate synthase [Lachnospiraceae bacterium]
MAIFTGAGVAIVTPMKDNEEVNYEKLEELIEEQIAGGTDAIVIVGTTGEGSTLTMEEHSKCIKAAVEFTKKRIPVVAGTGSNCTKTAIQLTEEAESFGADAALVVTPYYNKATQEGLIRHYSMIADSTKMPLILYNVPGRTGTNIQPQTVATLTKTKSNIVGIKDATGNLAQTAETMRLCDGNLELYSGEDGLVVPILSLGGIGVISVVSNIAPKQTHNMVLDYLTGDTKKALDAQLKVLPLVDALFCEVNPIPVKKAMNLMGKNVGPLRAPLCEMQPENAARLEKAMKEFGIL